MYKLKNRNMKNKNIIMIVLLSTLLFVGVGFALISSSLGINGNVSVDATSFDVHFENIAVTSGSMSATKAATIASNNTTKVDFSLNLTTPGEYYEFTVDVVNKGTLDAYLASATQSGITSANSKYLKFTTTYADGSAISANAVLAKNESVKVKVRVDFLADISASDLPASATTFNLSYVMDYRQK